MNSINEFIPIKEILLMNVFMYAIYVQLETGMICFLVSTLPHLLIIVSTCNQ